jgi:integrase/recombinase XerD
LAEKNLTVSPRNLAKVGFESLPVIFARAGENASRRFVEFFTAEIRNKNTRRAYAEAVRQFCDWCDGRGIELAQLQPIIIAGYVEQLSESKSKPTVKQHLAAIRMLCDYLVLGQIVPMNPAASVRGPKYTARRGKTPVLNEEQARSLLESIDASELIGLRDRALVSAMVYTFGRVSAVAAMKVEDYYQNGKKWWLRLHEKNGKVIEMPAHHKAEEFIDAYIEAAGLWGDKKAPLFQSMNNGKITGKKMNQPDVFRMIRRRALAASLEVKIGCHTWRGTGITNYLENGGSLEKAQRMAGHESSRTTGLYDRRDEENSLDEVERIRI